jgi:protein gp37
VSDNTSIEWTDATWNPITGCTIVSPGCTNCYAMKLAGTRLKHHPTREGLTKDSKAGPVWTGEVRFNERQLLEPLGWKRPRTIFVCAHGDLFHESVPDAWIDRVFAVMALTPHHTYQVLTKRPERMRAYVQQIVDSARWLILIDPRTDREVFSAWATSYLECFKHVWLGTSVEDQRRADERIPHLLATPAAIRFLSAEPLLGPIDLHEVIPDPVIYNAVHGMERLLQWVIVGGESGPGARPMHPDWARSLRDQCHAAGVPFFFKQWGNWEKALDRDTEDPDWRADYTTEYVDQGRSRWLNLEGGRGFHGERFHVMREVGKKAAGRLLDGIEHNAMPEVTR